MGAHPGNPRQRVRRGCGLRRRPGPQELPGSLFQSGSGPGSRAAIRDAIAGLKPRGQTPLAYALEQVRGDLAGVRGERAVVLVTDGIESCGGDPAAAARALRAEGVPVHVILNFTPIWWRITRYLQT